MSGARPSGTGSRASHRANSSVVSTKGFDPARKWPTGLPLVDALRSSMLFERGGGCTALPYEAAELIHDLYDALVAVVPALEEEIATLTDSYTNRCGPNEGKVTDADGLAWINEFREPLNKIRAALRKARGEHND